MHDTLAEPPIETEQRRRPGDAWVELEVHNASFLVDRLGGDCGDLQGLRELTVNALEAIAALDPAAPGRIVWDLDWERYDNTGGRQRKLCVIDTGTGMTAEEMRFYTKHLSASSRQQGRTGNFGVGAKIAAGSRNPHGLEYRSWKNGHGALARFKRGPEGRWGLEPQQRPDGHTDYWRPLTDRDKPRPCADQTTAPKSSSSATATATTPPSRPRA
jgi:hypothetical protein